MVALLLAAPLAAQTSAGRVQVYAPPNPQQTEPTVKRKDQAKLLVDAAASDWKDTGTTVRAGDTLTFSATGAVELAGHTLTPDGMTRGWRDMLRNFPVDAANAGALIGRIGSNAAAVPFTIGRGATVTAAQAGRLFLRLNTSEQLPATGTVKVDVRVAAAPQNSTAAPAANAFPTLLLQALDAMPHRVTDRDGAPGDAVNFAILGTEEQVRAAFERAGWVTVDADAGTAVLHGLLATLEHKAYIQVPMSTLYLFGRPQDMSFARASAISVASERHHLRCWKSGAEVHGAPLWVGAATHDIGFETDQRNGNVTHRIAPQIDEERDFLRDTFLAAGAAAAVAYFTPLDPVREAKTATGGSFVSDGRVLLVQVR